MRRAAWMALVFLTALSAAAAVRPEADLFLAEGAGARSQGMGGARAAVGEDLASMLANPAGLAGAPHSFAAHYAPSPLETTSLFTAYGRSVGPVYAALGLFQRRSSRIDLTDASGNALGSKAFTDQAALLSLAGGPVGLTLKRVQSKFAPYDVSGTGADLGFRAGWRLVEAGLVWQDVGGTALEGDSFFGGNARTRIPSRLRAGLAWETARREDAPPWSVLLAMDGLFALSGGAPPVYSLGLEVWSHGRLALRGGWDGDRGWSVGASLGMSKLRLDYAMLLTENAPALNRLTTHFFFGGTVP